MAFTLIEIMVVLAIMAILAAMILPEMRGTLDDALLRSSARKLVQACQVASSRAIALNQTQRLRVDFQAGRYVLEGEHAAGATDGPGNTRGRSPVEGRIDSRVTIELGGADAEEADTDASRAPASREMSELKGPESAGGGREVFTFHPDGTASGQSIVLRDREGFRLNLAIHPVTARLRVTELPRR